MLGRTVADPEKWKEGWLKWPPPNFLLIKYSLGHVNCFVSIHMLLQLSVFYSHHEEPCLSDWFASHHTLGLKEWFVQVNQRVLKQWHCTPKGPPIHLPWISPWRSTVCYKQWRRTRKWEYYSTVTSYIAARLSIDSTIPHNNFITSSLMY